jgi:hypothetical protein
VLTSFKHVDTGRPDSQWKTGFRLSASLLLLAAAIMFTWRTIDGLSSRRRLRAELAEISHVRYGLLNANRWVEKIVPILNANIDAMDLKAPHQASLRPAVESAIYRLLDDVKEKMSAKDSQSTGVGAFLGSGNSLVANVMVGALRPHVPEYADVVLAEIGKPANKEALKKYIKSVLAEGAQNTFGNVDMNAYSHILEQYGCGSNAQACQQELDSRIRKEDARIARYYLTVLVSSAVAFVLLMAGRPVLPGSSVLMLLLFCVVLLVGGVLTPMIEVEAKISRLGMTFLGEPIAFTDQLLYFQSKSVLEVFQTLITRGRPDMWFVGVLVLMFSIIFPIFKVFTLGFCLYKPVFLRGSRVVRFLALESSKWSMADVMALAIFMSFVAFNGLVANAMDGVKGTGVELAIPTDSSQILPGYHLFIGFCLASLLLSKKLERGIKTARDAGPT